MFMDMKHRVTSKKARPADELAAALRVLTRLDVDVVDPNGLLLVHRSFDDVDVRANGLEVRRVRLR